MRYVLDSSVAFKWVVPEQDSESALRLREGFVAGKHELVSPDFFPGEVAHALTRAERQGRITLGEALRLWSDVMATSPRLVASLPLMSRAIVISSHTKVGVFDCLYITLADREGCAMLSADSRLLRVVEKEYPFVVGLSSVS